MRRFGYVLVWVTGCGFSSPTGGARDGGLDAVADAAPDVAETPPGCRAVAIESMSAQNCVRRDDGEVWCWGRNEDGAIGVASDVMSCTANNACVRTPKKVTLAEPAVNLGLGDRHTCAMTATKVYCWGANGNGQFGDNSTAGATAPREIALRAGSTQLRGGDHHTCGVDDGAVFCSGRNMFGEIGDQSTTQRQTPTAVTLDGTVTAIGAGYHHSCAIAGGAVSCWGQNNAGQVDTTGNNPVSAPRATGVDATSVVGGTQHTCARESAGAVRCWGGNAAGQLGVGDTNPRSGPQLLGITGVSQIVAGVDHTCVLAGTGVWCWGERYTSEPTQVNLGAPAIAVSAGSYHDCAILMDGTVRCWGTNTYGQLGNGTLAMSNTPVQAVVCP